MIPKNAAHTLAHGIVRGEPVRVVSIQPATRSAVVVSKDGRQRSEPLAEISGFSTISLFGSGG